MSYIDRFTILLEFDCSINKSVSRFKLD